MHVSYLREDESMMLRARYSWKSSCKR